MITRKKIGILLIVAGAVCWMSAGLGVISWIQILTEHAQGIFRPPFITGGGTPQGGILGPLGIMFEGEVLYFVVGSISLAMGYDRVTEREESPDR